MDCHLKGGGADPLVKDGRLALFIPLRVQRAGYGRIVLPHGFDPFH
jgi:hypothetical protein